jgi:hypothetical protein
MKPVSKPPPPPRTDQILDITLWLEIALLAGILWQWHPPVRPFPPIFATPSETPRPAARPVGELVIQPETAPKST